MRLAVLEAAVGAGLALAGCTAVRPESPCADVAGRYLQTSDPPIVRLAELLAPGRQVAARAPRVVIASAEAGQALEVRFDSESVTLRRGVNFTCEAAGLRLSRPRVAGLDLGELFADQTTTFFVLSKAQDGSLRATTTYRESARVGGVPLAGPEHDGRPVRWRAVQ